MYEKVMYKVPSKNNKVIYRLQDFTKNDNVDESVFSEGQNSKGAKRLQCNVKVLHENEFEAILEELEQANIKIEKLNNKIMQKNVEIKRLQGDVAKQKRANIDENLQLYADKFNILQDHKEEIDELNKTHKKELLTIDKSHKETLKKIRSNYTRKLEDANEDLLNEVKENDKARDKLRGEMLELKDSHKQEVLTLQDDHFKEVEKIQHAHSDELQALQEKHTYDVDQLKEAIADMKEKHLVEVDDIRTKFMKLLANEHAQDLSDLNECEDLPFYVKPFAKTHIKALDEFKKRKYMNTPQKIVETYELEKALDK